MYDKMLPDSECVKIMADILQKVDVGEFQIKINHRKLLDGMFEVCGVPQDKIRCVSSSIDKLDKVRQIRLYVGINDIVLTQSSSGPR